MAFHTGARKSLKYCGHSAAPGVEMRLSPFSVAIPALILTSLSGHAAVFVQTTPFNFSASGSNVASELVPEGALSATVNPFNPGIGTLTSFSVVWSMNYGLEWTNDSSGMETASLMEAGGSLILGGITYGGAGGGSSNGEESGAFEHLSLSFSIAATDTHSSPTVDFSYDPSIWGIVTGGSPFTVAHDITMSPQLGHVSSWSATGVGSVQVSYTYTPAPEPLSTGLATAGLLAVAVGVRHRQRAR